MNQGGFLVWMFSLLQQKGSATNNQMMELLQDVFLISFYIWENRNMVRHRKGGLTTDQLLQLCRLQKQNGSLTNEESRNKAFLNPGGNKQGRPITSHLPSFILSSSWLLCSNFTIKKEDLQHVLIMQVLIMQEGTFCWKESFREVISHSTKEAVFFSVFVLFCTGS